MIRVADPEIDPTVKKKSGSDLRKLLLLQYSTIDRRKSLIKIVG